MHQPQRDALDFVSRRHDTMVEQLHQLCNINSGSDNLAGLASTCQELVQLFMPIADEISTKTLQPAKSLSLEGKEILRPLGDALYIRKRPDLSRRILLLGHMDTVFPMDHPFQTLRHISDNLLNGPGVTDMKGGLLIILHALAAFEQTDEASDLGWDVLITPDEEIASPGSSILFESLANLYQTVLVYEPALDIHGTLAKNRKGSGLFTLIAKGKAAHAGRAFHEGRNAICHLAEIITAIHALNDQNPEVTINLGQISGGTALNVVPEQAVVKFNIRITSPENVTWCYQQLNEIILNHQKEGYTLSLHGDFHRPVKRVNSPTLRLFNRISKIAHQLGLKVSWQDTGGCCDGNNWAHFGLPVIDTLGVRGGDIHSANEFILLDSLVERTSLSTLLLMDLAQGSLEDLYSHD